MLTGDENIVDVDFSVFWMIKPTGAGRLSVQHPDAGRHGEGGGRKRYARGRSAAPTSSRSSPARRQNIETARARADAEERSISYGAGVQVTQVQLQKVDPPTQVIDSFRDVQAARADLRARAERSPDLCQPGGARRRAAVPRRSLQAAEAYREQTVAEATGQTVALPAASTNEYKKAPEVTRQRMYLETMERLLGGNRQDHPGSGGANGGGVVPFLPLDQSSCGHAPPAAPSQRRNPKRERR